MTVSVFSDLSIASRAILSILQDVLLSFLTSTMQHCVSDAHHTHSALRLAEATSLDQEMIMWHPGGREKKHIFFCLITVIVFHHLCFICMFLGNSSVWLGRFRGIEQQVYSQLFILLCQCIILPDSVRSSIKHHFFLISWKLYLFRTRLSEAYIMARQRILSNSSLSVLFSTLEWLTESHHRTDMHYFNAAGPFIRYFCQ